MNDEFEHYLQNYENIFPLGISCLKSLYAKAFSSKFFGTKLNTICWRFSTFVFYNTEGFVLTRNEWKNIISKKRTQFSKLQEIRKRYTEEQDSNKTSKGMSMNSDETVDKIRTTFTFNYIVVSSHFDVAIFNSLFNILDLIINDQTPDNIIEIICIVVSRMYLSFIKEIEFFESISKNVEIEGRESIEDLKFLFSRKDVYCDIYNCVKGVMAMLCPFFDKENPALISNMKTKISHQIKRYSCISKVPETIDTNAIISIYEKLFIMSKEQRNDYEDILTALFSRCPNSTIFHIFYSWMYANGIKPTDKGLVKVGEDGEVLETKIDVKGMLREIGFSIKVISNNSYTSHLIQFKNTIRRLNIHLETSELTDYFKSVIKYQLSEIAKVIKQENYIEEIVPLEVFIKTK